MNTWCLEDLWTKKTTLRNDCFVVEINVINKNHIKGQDNDDVAASKETLNPRASDTVSCRVLDCWG